MHGKEVTPPWKPLWLRFRRVRGLRIVTPKGVVGQEVDTITREPRPRKLKGKEKSWQEEPGELEEQWWCGVRGEERGGVKSGGSSTFFEKSSSCYS